MPSAIAIIASSIADSIYAATAITLTFTEATVLAVATVVGVSIGASAVLEAAIGSPTPEALKETVRQTMPPRRRGGGTARIGGAYGLDFGVANTLRQVVFFVDGPVEISNYYLSQDEVTIGTVDGDTDAVNQLPGGAYGIYSGAPSVQLDFALGETGVPIFSFFNSILPGAWPSTCTATGIFCGALRAQGGNEQTFQTRFPRGSPKLNIAGKLCVHFDWRDPGQSRTDPTTWVNSANPIVGLVHELWNFRGYDWDLDFAPSLDILTAEADLCDAPTPYLNVLAKVVLFTGAGGTHVDIAATAPTPPNGVTLYLGGQQVTVTGTTSMTTDGVALKQVSFSGGPLTSDSTAGSLVRWQATPTHPATEPTYAYGGAWNVDEREADTVKRFLDTMDGWMMRRGADGAVVLRCGHYYEPTVTIGADEVIGYTWQPFVEAGRTVNQLLPAFVCPALDYNQVDTTPWEDDGEIAVNGISSQKFEPDMVQSNGQVRRLCKPRLHRLLAHPETLTLKASGIRAIGERFIRVQMGGDEATELADIVLEVIGDFEILDGGMTVQAQVQQADPAIYDWDAYTDEGDGPAATSSNGAGSLTTLTAPTISLVSSFTQDETDGGSPAVGVRLAVSITPPAAVSARTDLTWFVRWMLSGGNSWQQSSTPDLAAGDVTVDTGFVPTTGAVVVQAAYQTGGGQMSSWSASATPGAGIVTTAGLDLGIEGGGKILQER